jgi:hypothetical protein
MGAPVPHPKFQLFQDGRGHYRFRLTAPNSEALFESEVYATKAGCRRGIHAVREHAAGAAYEDLTEEPEGR